MDSGHAVGSYSTPRLRGEETSSSGPTRAQHSVRSARRRHRGDNHNTLSPARSVRGARVAPAPRDAHNRRTRRERARGGEEATRPHGAEPRRRDVSVARARALPPPSSAPLTNLGANRAPCLRTAATPRHTSRISSFTKTLGHPVISDDARVVVRGETGHRSREAEPVSNHQRTVSGERPTIARTPGTGASSILVLKRPSARRGPGIVSVDRNVRSKCRCSCVLQFTS